MKTLDPTVKIQDLAGVELEFSIGFVIAGALQTPEQLGAGEKWQRWQVAKKIQAANGPVEFSIDELKTIKDVVGRHCPTMAYGRILEWMGETPAA